MFILAVKGFEEDGAFSIENDDGDKVLLMLKNKTYLVLPVTFFWVTDFVNKGEK